jgi:hypothetical protein
MTAHVIAAPVAAPTAVFPAPPGWATLSAAFGNEVPVIADRDDLTVTVAPGAGHGAPACFFPALAAIEVDGIHLDPGVDPATVAPHRIGDRKRYRTAWGLLTHECAHAKHSVWRTPVGAPPGAVAAADLLEESRIEAAHLRRRPRDRYWLRASATNLILTDTHANDPANAPTMSTHDAATAAALLLARVDGGVLNRRETTTVRRVVTDILGDDTLTTLRNLWREAHRTADDDAPAMIELGRKWCEALGADPDDPTPPTPNGNGTPSPLADAIAGAARAVARAVARAAAPTDPVTQALHAKADDDAARAKADDDARVVFAPGQGGNGRSPVAGTRAPRVAERTAARQLARSLDTAGIRARVALRDTSATPPGRLRMRGALAVEAQRAAGAEPTAEPFSSVTRTTVPAPPLRLAVACDVSSSMGAFTGPVASSAWILAHAAAHAQVPATTATVTFGESVHPITRPGTPPRHVTEFAAGDCSHHVDTAINALDGALGLSRPDAARLLVIVSDGRFEADRYRAGQTLLNRLRASGCAVLWLAPDKPGNTPMTGATLHALTDPATTARAIGQAATAALRATV